jgi:predicted metal-dependent peptidase
VEVEGDLLRKTTAEAIASAAKGAPGTLSAAWKLWAEQYLSDPKVAWEDELMSLVQSAVTMSRGAFDYSYNRPSRRGSPFGVIQPVLVRPDIDAAVVVDTSGSMCHRRGLPRALAEIEGILRAIGQRRVPIFCCDAAVCGDVQRVSDALDIELLGGGGTNMGVGIAAAEAAGHAVIIVATDGETPWPDAPPAGELVVVLVNASQHWVKSVPAYASRVIVVDDDPEEAPAEADDA